jgi:hypothetical protein
MFPNRSRGRRGGRRRTTAPEPESLPPTNPQDAAGYEPDDSYPAQVPAGPSRPAGPEDIPPPRGGFDRSRGGRRPSSAGGRHPAPRGTQGAARRDEPVEPWPTNGGAAGPRDHREPLPPREAGHARAAETAPRTVHRVSLAPQRNTLAEVSGVVTYRGRQIGDAVVIGLFDPDAGSGQLEYWVEIDGPGPYVLDGIKTRSSSTSAIWMEP